MSLRSRVQAFAAMPVGYVVLVVLLAALCGLTLGALLIPVGAIILLAFAFGLPIYFGWNLSLKKFLSVALVVFLIGPLFTGIVTTGSVLTPPGTLSSTDNVLQNGQVTPFQNTAGHPSFTFQVDVDAAADNSSRLYLREVYLWVTNCETDTDNASHRGGCFLSPPDKFLNVSQAITPAQDNRTQPFPVTFNVSSLPSGEIFYFLFLTAVSSKNASSVVYYAFNSNVGGWSCTTLPTYSGCTWAEGPVSATWLGVYAFLAPGDYVSMALCVAVLAAIILLYAYLKGRERARRAQARAAATGEETTPPTAELRCPHCNAVVEPGEKTCWKCKQDLTGSNKPQSGGPASKGSAPLPSSGSSPAPASAPKGSTAEPASPGPDDAPARPD